MRSFGPMKFWDFWVVIVKGPSSRLMSGGLSFGDDGATMNHTWPWLSKPFFLGSVISVVVVKNRKVLTEIFPKCPKSWLGNANACRLISAEGD